MYAYIKGEVTHKAPDHLIVEAYGIGYLILASAGLIERFPSVGDQVMVHTHHYVREDTMALYGFPDQEDLSMFQLLLTVSGVGPKVASMMVGSMSPGAFAMAVVTGDTKALTSVKGIGKKGAERMILELKDKLKGADLPGEMSAGADTGGSAGGVGKLESEAVSALMVLGYSGSESAQAVQAVYSAELKLEELIRQALRSLSRQR